MVQELQRQRQSASFPETAPAANPVFFRTYSRRTPAGLRESWDEVCDRTLQGLVELGKLTPEEAALLDKMQRNMKALPSGRWLWVGGTEWLKKSKNFSGAYNCTSTNLTDWKAFGLMMDLAMMGCGTGAIIEPKYINQLPPIRNRLNVTITGEVGNTPVEQRREFTEVVVKDNTVNIHVGDSREGWVQSYQTLLELSTDERFTDEVQVIVDISDVRQSGETLKGFGGVANPVKLSGLYERCASILNKAIGRKLTSVECCLLIDEAAVSIVAGNIRRCLPDNALVHTEAGLVPIAKVRIGDRVLTSKGFYPVTNFFIQGEQSLCRIQTQDGSFECTADHKVAVLTDVYGNYKMVKAKDLQPGDRLIFVPQAIPGTATELPEFRGKITGKTKPITIPALTPDVAYFIGYLHGDGSVSSDGSRVRFRVHEDSPQILEHLIAVGREFGLDTHTLITPEQCQTKAYELQFNSAALNQYLGLFKQPSQPLNVPDCILLGKADIRQAYLAGLADADGCHSQGVLVASVQQRFLQQVQALYASLGITTRVCSSIRKRTGKWEGELVTVGETAYQAVENSFEKYSLQYSSQKRQTPTSFQDHGFPKTMVRPIINSYQYHWSNNQEQMIIPTLKKNLPETTDLVPVKVLGVDFDVRTAPTYDIEVATVHEFVCEGILVSNSAGMRQFVAEDQQGATAKDNLWQQDVEGNWHIDPDRDALRMSNHTRVFHRKPTLEESIAAVQKQYYSGEGAIQWAGEAVARANIDILNTPELKKDFLQAYEQGKAKAWIQEHHPNIDDQELEHRLGRYGLNPCHAGDTLVSTNQGLVPIKELVGKPFQALIDLRAVGLDGVRLTDAIAFPTGVQTTYLITLANGQQMRCTADHQHFTNHGWVATKDLTPDHHIYIQKGAGYFGEGTITVEQAQMLGWWYGDGSIYKGYKGLDAVFYINQNEYETAFPVLTAAVESLTGYSHKPSLVKGVYTFHSGSPFMDSFFNKLGVKSKDYLPDQFLSQSQEVILGFLQGLFSADGCVNVKGRNIELRNRSRQLLAQIQIILLNLGIKSSLLIKEKPGSRGVPYTLKDGTEKVSQNRGSWRLIIYSGAEARKFWQLIGFPLTPDKQERLATLATKESSRKYSEAIISQRFSSKVKSIEEFGEEPVYDLHVPLTHSFIANGCITHNCGEIIGANFHCVSGDTLLITKDGMHKIKDVVGCDIEIWNGKNWSQVQPFKTGSSRVLYRVRFADGTYLDATEYHRFFVKDRFGKNYKEVQTKDLMNTSNYAIHTEPFTIEYEDGLDVDVNYAYTLGVAVGDGTTDKNHNAKVRLYEQKAVLSLVGNKSPIREYDYLPAFTDVTDLGFSGEFLKSLKTNPEALNVIASWKRQAILHFIAGLADTDGSNTSSNGIRIYISDYDRAYRVQLLLTKCGIRSSLNLCAHKGAVTNYGIRSRDLYYLQITDCGEIPCQRLDVSKGKPAKHKGKWQVVKSVEQLPGLHDTYCFNEPEYHKGVFGNTLTGNCNLAEVHLNQLDPDNYKEQEEAFKASALSVATLLNHHFQEPRYQYSRELDPIVGVSFTGLFDFFVHAFGVDWLRWWEQGRPETEEGLIFKRGEQKCLSKWREIVHKAVWEYCDKHGIKRPNRCTTVQPAGTKSLLSGASPGWHPPKAQRFIRRITFRKNDPVALACIDYGYNVIPSQSDKDENGNLLNDPFDPRCTEWLVEIPVAVSWADLTGADEIDVSKFSVLAQLDFVMQVQKYYTTHNTSATLELRSEEVETLGTRIYEAIQKDEGYISAALLARFDDIQTFPRLPFEPIDKETYERLSAEVKARRKTDDFCGALSRYDLGEMPEAGPSGCDSDKCMFPEQAPT
ncbi:ribonucleoside-triphosphate reductase, adenosylcobalamin-dependent [Sphaerospermopsis sp. LEGE 08334]|uniref:ribonucleoside-triphosphate reductase, adenosylcobalamin-dependent n=1 Tax=Sphaerospermopsis sp. LEGE 08334 TaxID=1828651 RepID=UPI0018829C08|nr:ribonucleoside-triphosphate reductase, adenosylcobalamin-dependent [Sphaerospermopsis sp. LEGE 08334]MBE9055115.1 ribonucleoside-triphosphate reductase, adenosylcobalamin-dependent [Sphaerospermopsis sp. LEGE 08334]